MLLISQLRNDKNLILTWPSISEDVTKSKVGQRYLLKSLWKKKYTDWYIQKILFFVIENKGVQSRLEFWYHLLCTW